MAFAWPKLSPVTQIALGLSAQTAAIVMLIAVFMGVLPDRVESARKLRIVLSESITQQVVSLLPAGDMARLENALRGALSRDEDLRSIGVRRVQGELIAKIGVHPADWQAVHGSNSDDFDVNNIIVPINVDTLRWGSVELSFRPVTPQTLTEWIRYPPVLAALLISVLGFGAFYLYMRRSLEYLDPQAVIPERVRTAYDTFQEGVVILDTDERIVLANERFRNLHPEAGINLSAKHLSSLTWLTDRVSKVEDRYPWVHALATKTRVIDETVVIPQPDGDYASKIVVLNCSPILDGYGNSRGCIVTVSDVTALHQANDMLRGALENLAVTMTELDGKNKELHRLATQDPMTGCLNRRALFELIEPMYARLLQSGGELCCIMGDIDHFKRFNDTYGHAVGDQVIKVVARSLHDGLREGDILCRYGGEEFCIFLPNADTATARRIADGIRHAIDTEAGAAVE
ncbi:hypothetical protein B566_EDAN019081, partial [Ephemera danica]